MSVWDWDYFWSYAVNTYLLAGAVTTIWLTAVSLALGLVLGLGIALMRMSSLRAVSVAAQGYTWVFRGTPLLVQLIIIYTGLPQLGLSLNVIESAIVGLVLNEAAYLSEILRAGIQAIAKGQWEAAFSLGLTRWRTFRKVILPQAMRVIIPPLGNSVNGLLKTTSIASVISMEELLRRGQILQQEHFAVLEIFTIIAILYLAMTTCWDVVQHHLEKYYGRGFGETVQLARDDR
jgi:polar amino acid transport system permease protein